MAFTLPSIQFVTISLDYLKTLHDADIEVSYMANNNYESKPHVGILINNNGYDYVIPLTSAKPKHSRWRHKEENAMLIYEIVPRNICDSDDVLKELPGDSPYDCNTHVERIMSVLLFGKMIPIKSGVYNAIDFSSFDLSVKEERQRRNLLEKEYKFCLKIQKEIVEKANKIYDKQMRRGVLPMYCDFKKLERICNTYGGVVENVGVMEEAAATKME